MHLEVPFWFHLSEAIGVLGLLIWTIIMHVSNRHSRHINDSATRLAKQEKELARLEEKMKSVPSDEDLRNIHDRISEGNVARQSLAVQVGKLESGVERLEHSVGRIEDHLIGSACTDG